MIIYTICLISFGRSTIDRKYTRDVNFFHQDAGIRSGSHYPFRDGPTHQQRGSTTWKESWFFRESWRCQACIQRFLCVQFFLVSGTFTIPKYVRILIFQIRWKGVIFLQKRLRFKQNTFGHDGSHNYIHRYQKSNRKHRCLLSALHLISYIFQIMLPFDVNIGNRVFTSLKNPFIDIPSSRSLLGVSGVQIYWTLWTFYQRNAISIRSWHHVDIIFQSVSHVYAKCGSPPFQPIHDKNRSCGRWSVLPIRPACNCRFSLENGFRCHVGWQIGRNKQTEENYYYHYYHYYYYYYYY